MKSLYLNTRSFSYLFDNQYQSYYRSHSNPFALTKAEQQISTKNIVLINYIFKSILESRYSNNNSIHCLLLEKLTLKQQLNIKESIVDANNRLNRVFPSFIPFSNEFLPRNRLIDIYSSCFFSILQTNTKKAEKHIFKSLTILHFKYQMIQKQ